MKKGLLIAATVLAAMWVIGSVMQSLKSSSPAVPVDPTSEVEVTAEMVIDFMVAQDSTLLSKLCETVEFAGYRIAFAAFQEGYDTGNPNAPPAKAIFEEAVSRC
jgi:hypothetical protein